jgi:hypothetical protein
VYTQQIWFAVCGKPGRWRYAGGPPSVYNERDDYLDKTFVINPLEMFEGGRSYLLQVDPDSKFLPPSGEDVAIHSFFASICVQCQKPALWRAREMIYPGGAGVAPANPDLEEHIRADYAEAASVLNASPRSAAALLRLCVQNLCVQLGLPGQNLNGDIGELVKRGLNPDVQRALDALRVIGNNALHPLEMDLRDDRETAVSLFGLINFIAEQMVTNPKKLARVFDLLPPGAKDAIKKRDGG